MQVESSCIRQLSLYGVNPAFSNSLSARAGNRKGSLQLYFSHKRIESQARPKMLA